MNKTISKILIFLVALLFCADVFAQASFIARRNDNAATVQILANGQLGALAADSTGRLFINPGVAADSLGKAEDAAHTSGDTGVQVLGVRQDTPGTVCGTNGDYCPLSVTSKGSTRAAIEFQSQDTAANGILKQEDAAAAGADAGVGILAKRQDSFGAQTNQDGDYAIPSTNSFSILYTDIRFAAQSSAADGLLKLEDSAAASGDAGVLSLGVASDGTGAATAAAGDYIAPAYNVSGAQLVDINVNFRSNQATSILKTEDLAAASGDALVGVAGVINDTYATKASDGDYTAPSLTSGGAALSVLVYDSVGTVDNKYPIKREDSASADLAALIGVATVREDALTVNSSTTGDYSPFKSDAVGRLITTLAPAGETWQICSAYIGTAANTSLKAAVTSNRIYVTKFSCIPNAVTTNQVFVTDGLGGTNMDALFVGPNTTGSDVIHTYPTPLRLTSATALGFTTAAASSVLCCASGYISVN